MILFFMCKCSTVQNKNNTKFTKQLTKIPNRTRETSTIQGQSGGDNEE